MIVRVRDESGATRDVTVTGNEALIGKHADCQVVLADPKVSRRHAKIVARDGGFQIEDLGSTNGTRVGGQAVAAQAPRSIRDGEEITIGSFHLTLVAEDPSVKTLVTARDAAAASASAPTIPPASVGLGPLKALFADDSVSEIMVNGPDEVFVERKGQIEATELRFASADELRKVIAGFAADVGRGFDEQRPLLDARLPDGSRINAVMPPLAVRGPYLTIRRFPAKRLNADQLVEIGSLSAAMLAFLRVAVAGRVSILVSGGTGSGKTTLLAALCGFIPPNERVVTIEDSAELRLPLRHAVPLEGRPPDGSGQGEITIRDLVRNALRMRPDRIVVGEVRGAEALDMLQAMNTGHEGSLSTVHANSPREALQRLETLVLFAGTELPQRAVREQIVGAIPLIVHVSRGQDGKRRVTSVEELTGLESGQYTTGTIFSFDPAKGGAFVAEGYVPRIRDRLAARGVTLDNRWFQPS